jgi:hypothetical protein
MEGATMTEQVKRWTPSNYYEDDDMKEVVDGGWVDFDDYARLAARVGELERERDGLKADNDAAYSVLCKALDLDECDAEIPTLADLADRLAAKLAQHHDLFKPFAEAADMADRTAKFLGDDPRGDEHTVGVSYGDCRRARDVMEAGRG